MKVLFVSHNATRTGAPLLLLNFLKWFKVNSSLQFLILLKDGGPLLPEFLELATTYVYSDDANKSSSVLGQVSRRFMRHKHSKSNEYLELFKQEDIGLVYVNTATNGELYNLLHELHCPIITHVHELEIALRIYTEKRYLDQVEKYTDYFIANSQATKTNLVDLHKIPEDQISICPSFISLDVLNSVTISREEVCEEIKIPLDSFIVCSSGTTIWCKSPDIFIQLAHSVLKKIPLAPVCFVWIGAFYELNQDQLLHDINEMGLRGKVLFLGEKSEPLKYFAACNVFTQVSREDSFGLVCIEAAAMAKPIACFDKAGGMSEFVENDAGYVAPYLDFNSMADFIVRMYGDKTLCNKLGHTAREKVLARHSIDNAAPMILNVIEMVIMRHSGVAV